MKFKLKMKKLNINYHLNENIDKEILKKTKKFLIFKLNLFCNY